MIQQDMFKEKIPKTYKLITLEDRRAIEKMLLKGASVASIVATLGRSQETIYSEIRRCGKKENYRADEAHRIAMESKERKGRRRFKILGDLVEAIKPLVSRRFTNRQICISLGIGRITLDKALRIIENGPKALIPDSEQRLEALEMQVETLFEIIKEMKK